MICVDILTIPSRGRHFLLSQKHPTTSEVWGVIVNSLSQPPVSNSPSLFECGIWQSWLQMFCLMFFPNICGLFQIFLWKWKLLSMYYLDIIDLTVKKIAQKLYIFQLFYSPLHDIIFYQLTFQFLLASHNSPQISYPVGVPPF